jgi:hypothetical protein
MTQGDLEIWSLELLLHWYYNPPTILTKRGWQMIAVELRRRGELECEADTEEFAAINPRDMQEGADHS